MTLLSNLASVFNMTVLFYLCNIACLLALVLAVLSIITRSKVVNILTTGALAAGLLGMTVFIVWRWIEAGRAPFSDMFESLFLFAWSIVLVQLALSFKVRIRWLDAAAALMAALTLAYAGTFPRHIKPLMPALQSPWLQTHVLTCFLGYAGFAVSFAAAIIHLIASKATSSTHDTLESVVTQTVSFGFLFLTIGIATGSVWANSAWGSYWTWDPKETWSLITWFVYAMFLHFRFRRDLRGARASWMSIAGFACVLITYFGVNYLSIFKGLHSYA